MCGLIKYAYLLVVVLLLGGCQNFSSKKKEIRMEEAIGKATTDTMPFNEKGYQFEYFEPGLLKINDVKYEEITHDNIQQVLGKPDTITYPQFECGFLSADEQGKVFQAVTYSGICLIGAKDEPYTIDSIRFQNLKGITIKYRGQPLTNKTSIKAFEKLFKVKVKNDYINLSSYIKTENKDIVTSDDHQTFFFKEGFLFEMHYWSPC